MVVVKFDVKIASFSAAFLNNLLLWRSCQGWNSLKRRGVWKWGSVIFPTSNRLNYRFFRQATFIEAFKRYLKIVIHDAGLTSRVFILW